MFALYLLDEASKELVLAAQWYETKKQGLGDRFINAIEKKLLLIKQFPERYPIRRKNFREALVKTFPY